MISDDIDAVQAIHESGHCCCVLEFGGTVLSVEIGPNGSGECRFCGLSPSNARLMTLGGARALGRSDIGQLTAGAKADLVLVDTTLPAMQPLRDPLRSLIYVAADRAVRHVFVGGAQVVADGHVTTMDLAAASAELREAQQRLLPQVRQLDWAHRSHLDISPLVYGGGE